MILFKSINNSPHGDNLPLSEKTKLLLGEFKLKEFKSGFCLVKGDGSRFEFYNYPDNYYYCSARIHNIGLQEWWIDGDDGLKDFIRFLKIQWDI